MICLCIKDKLLETYKCNPLILSLCQMSCSWCKNIQSDNFEIDDSNKYQMMFIESIFCTMKQSKEVIMRIFDILRLEEIQNKFPVDENCDAVIQYFFEVVSKINGKNESNVIVDYKKCFNEMSEFTLLEVIKRLLFHSNFSFAQAVILEYFQVNVTIMSSSFRQRFYFRPKKSDEVKAITISHDSANYQYYSSPPFFDIGWALDEGSTESTTREIMDIITDKNYLSSYSEFMHKEKGLDDSEFIDSLVDQLSARDNNKKTRYFFEVKFFEKMMSIFDSSDEEKRKKLKGKIAFENYATTFLSNLTNYSNDKCDFYNFYHYTDNQKWKEANLLLNKILSTNIDVESL